MESTRKNERRMMVGEAAVRRDVNPGHGFGMPREFTPRLDDDPLPQDRVLVILSSLRR